MTYRRECVKCAAAIPPVRANKTTPAHYCRRCCVLLNIGGVTKFGSGFGPAELGGRYDDWRSKVENEPIPIPLYNVAQWPELFDDDR